MREILIPLGLSLHERCIGLLLPGEMHNDVSELRCRARGILESVGLSLIQFDTCLELSRSELAKKEK